MKADVEERATLRWKTKEAAGVAAPKSSPHGPSHEALVWQRCGPATTAVLTRIPQMRTFPGEVRARFRYIVQRNSRDQRSRRWTVRRVKKTMSLFGLPSILA